VQPDEVREQLVPLIVQATIGRSALTVLERVAAVIAESTSPAGAIADAVTTALTAIGESPMLAPMLEPVR
jgi:hypothetical protein